MEKELLSRLLELSGLDREDPDAQLLSGQMDGIMALMDGIRDVVPMTEEVQAKEGESLRLREDAVKDFGKVMDGRELRVPRVVEA